MRAAVADEPTDEEGDVVPHRRKLARSKSVKNTKDGGRQMAGSSHAVSMSMVGLL